MTPITATPEQAQEWAQRDECDQFAIVIGGPDEGPDVTPCPALGHEETS